MNIYKTKHYKIIDSKNKISKKIIRICSDAYKINKRFFKKDCKKFTIKIANDEKEFKKLTKRFYQPWVKGVSMKWTNIILRSPKLYRETYKKYKGTFDMKILLAHEINHIYADQLNLYKGPYWFTEGLAMYVAGQIPGKTYKRPDNVGRGKARELMFYRFMYRKLCAEMYSVYYSGVMFLIKRFGKKKLLKLINSYKKNMKKRDYEGLFKRIYSISYNDFLRDFLKGFDNGV